MIIVIDGPSGSGKSSTAKAVAEKLGIEYLDSGALYRAVTLIWLEEERPSESEFLDILSSKKIRFEYTEGTFCIRMNGRDLTLELRRPYVSDHVSRVAALPKVRGFVNRLMREAVRNGLYIADGRDLGTVVFPDADLKIYMDASLDVRADRRFDELKNAGESISRKEVKENLRLRDHADSTRDEAPLVQPEGAKRIDTSRISFDEQVEEISSYIATIMTQYKSQKP